MNPKRIYRLYNEMGLQLRNKAPKRRVPGLNQRTTPELKGRVVKISAETSLDEATGLRFFTVRLRFLEGEREKIGGNILMPGMPVDALIQTGERTILSYLIKPIQDQIAHAMREE